MFLLVAHRANNCDHRFGQYTHGVFVCEEIEAEAAVESHIEKILAEYGLDDDEFSVYEIVPILDEYGDRNWTSNVAERFVTPARVRVVAAQQAAMTRLAEAKRISKEQAERTYYERLKAKYEPSQA